MTEKLDALSLLQAGWAKVQFVPAPAVIAARLTGVSMQDFATLLAVVLLLVQIAAVITANWEKWRRLPGYLARKLRGVIARGRA